jgi:hypothetical protein
MVYECFAGILRILDKNLHLTLTILSPISNSNFREIILAYTGNN